jgi:hypothetical protein
MLIYADSSDEEIDEPEDFEDEALTTDNLDQDNQQQDLYSSSQF